MSLITLDYKVNATCPSDQN